MARVCGGRLAPAQAEVSRACERREFPEGGALPVEGATQSENAAGTYSEQSTAHTIKTGHDRTLGQGGRLTI
jgi:hypothetical protein